MVSTLRIVVFAVGLLCIPGVVIGQGSYTLDDGSPVDFDRARAAHREVLFGAPAHPGRMALEQTTTLVIGSAWYWIYKDLNATDWDLEPTAKNFGRRFWDTSMWRFDTNRFFVNQGHIVAGSVHYAIPRNNEFGVFASLGVGVLTSALWEWVFEYREYVSLNDLVVSPYGGQALGEVTYKLGELGDRQGASLSWPARALTYPFSRGRALHRALGDESPRFPEGLGPAMAHEFRAGVTPMLTGANLARPAVAASLHAEIVDLPGYARPGEFDTFFRDANFVTLDVEAQLGARPIERFFATARTDLVGWYTQSRNEEGGWALRVAFGRGVWLDVQESLNVEDLIGVVDLGGPVTALQLWYGDLHAELGAALYADFGSVTSLAYARTADEFAPSTLRTELEEQGYYFAWGLTGTPHLTLELGRWVTLVGSFDGSHFAGLHGPDRVHQNDIPRRVRLRDRRLALRAEARIHLGPVDAGLRYGRTRRVSQLDDEQAAWTRHEAGLSVGAQF